MMKYILILLTFNANASWIAKSKINIQSREAYSKKEKCESTEGEKCLFWKSSFEFGGVKLKGSGSNQTIVIDPKKDAQIKAQRRLKEKERSDLKVAVFGDILSKIKNGESLSGSELNKVLRYLLGR